MCEASWITRIPPAEPPAWYVGAMEVLYGHPWKAADNRNDPGAPEGLIEFRSYEDRRQPPAQPLSLAEQHFDCFLRDMEAVGLEYRRQRKQGGRRDAGLEMVYGAKPVLPPDLFPNECLRKSGWLPLFSMRKHQPPWDDKRAYYGPRGFIMLFYRMPNEDGAKCNAF